MRPLTYVRSWSKSEQPLEDPLNSSNIDDYQACTRLFTADTRAEIWDINLPGSQSKVLDDDALRSSLDHYYHDEDDIPTSMTIFFRCPKNTNCVSGMVRVQFSTRNCFAFLSCCYEEDVCDILKRCLYNIELLRIHPLYLLSIIYDHRFQRWTDWFAQLWKQVVELESITNMTHPFWKMSQIDAQRLRALSTNDALLTQLHATHLELCHSHTVISFATRFGKVCSDAVAEMEKRRQDLGYSPLSRRHASGIEDAFKTTLIRCDSIADRLAELSNRLTGQINVSYNLIAQKDSKVNLAIAKLQAQDSQTVKGIALLTLLFLPSTFLAVKTGQAEGARQAKYLQLFGSHA
ncbi:hypothetical protein ACLX1H_008082 [Fusarium chlamydosporum]